MTRSQLRARLTQILAETPEPPVRSWTRNQIQTVSRSDLVGHCRRGELIILSRPVVESLLKQLAPKRGGDV